jgi:tetratricopeptide (TPR) repeat protein
MGLSVSNYKKNITFVNIILLLLVFPCSVFAEKCEDWVGKIVSVQNKVQAQSAGKTQWVPVKLNDTYCLGDKIRVYKLSRVTIVLRNEAIVRLDHKTTVVFSKPKEEKSVSIDLVTGSAHFFSRVHRGLEVNTPFVYLAAIHTEFFVRVESDKTILSAFEGQVVAANDSGSLTLASGQSAVVQAGKAPVLRIVVHPRDAVQWALYYPYILDYSPLDFPVSGKADWQRMVHRSLQFYREGNVTRAFATLKDAPKEIKDPRFFIYRAGLLLTVGRVDEARADIEKALTLDPYSSHSYALLSIISVVQNNKDRALELAKKAVEFDTESSIARVALSYAYQSHFELKKALESLKKAVKLNPENAFSWARLSELWLSVGDLDRAVDTAREAVFVNPELARAHTVLGFAYLTRIEIDDAKDSFEKAIELDQADPLPRLGLGLAKIRDGDLEEGRREIEIAVSLDPNNSLIRSYLGKAYYEEKRDTLAKKQFVIAKEFDPMDPTPWFYDAIRKQTENRPVEALQDMQKAIELNDNRIIYRSRLLLDEDLAARSASLGRIYDDLGFQQLALVEGWKSLNTDPSNYSAHRFLADSYSALPRHEIARVSELLQSQLLQPLNITPVQPSLAVSNLRILEGAGPSTPSFNEFNTLFNRNRLTIQASGLAGGNETLGDELVHSGIWGKLSYSLGQFHYENKGLRNNNDQERDIYNIFAQMTPSNKTSLQTEYRNDYFRSGDLTLNFDPDDFLTDFQEKEHSESIRFGLHHAFTPTSALIVSVSYKNVDYEETDVLEIDDDDYNAEIQHLFGFKRFHITSGIGYFNIDEIDEEEEEVVEADCDSEDGSEDGDSEDGGEDCDSEDGGEDGDFEDGGEEDLLTRTVTRHTVTRHINLYTYLQLNFPETITWTFGGSADFLDGNIVDRDQFNPKLGLLWTPFSVTTLRAAIFRTLKRTLLTNQTIEPTQVAGFNQFFDDAEGTEAWHYGIGIDQKFSTYLYAGAEFFKRDLKIPGELPSECDEPIFIENDWKEHLGRAYINWTPHSWLSLSADYQFEYHRMPEKFLKPPIPLSQQAPMDPGSQQAPMDPGSQQGPMDPELIELTSRIHTHLLSLGVNFFHPSGLIVQLRPMYIYQDGKFIKNQYTPSVEPGDDQFLIVDASIGYRLPKRWGLITFEAKNLFDEKFKFQDTDPENPRISKERLFLLKFTLTF